MLKERPADLIDLLACPDCQSDLNFAQGSIQCPGCGRRFEVRNGIPILLPKDFDEAHFSKEETLAELMTSPLVGEQEKFSVSHWRESRSLFWSVVAQNTGPAPRTMINVGCGYDVGFRQLQDMGHFFVNSDLVYDMLKSLKEKSGARNCVAADVNRLPFRKKSVDCLISIDMLHHVSERTEPILRSFSELLKDGGALFLQDVNAWGMFQFPKSILMPRSVHGALRSFYYRNIHRDSPGPADYEFPTNPFEVRQVLGRLGFSEIVFFKCYSYPSSTARSYRFYKAFAQNERIAKYHNYHYLLMAKKSE